MSQNWETAPNGTTTYEIYPGHASIQQWFTTATVGSDIAILNGAGLRTELGMASADLDAQLDAIVEDTGEIGTAGAGLTDLGGMSTGMKSEVESEANDALVAQKLDHLVAAADGDDPVNGSIMAHLVSATEDWSTFVPSTDSLQAIRDHAATIKSTVDNIESGVGIIIQDTNEMQGKLPTNKFMGSSDGADDDGNINSILAGTVTNAQGADVATDVAAMIDVNNRVDVGSWLGTAVTLGSGAPDVNIASTDDIDLSATQKASVADTVWDETLTGSSHNIATSAGKRLRQIEQAFTHASGTIAAIANGHTMTLDGGAVGTLDYYIGDRLQITEGVGAGQSRVIVGYTALKVVTLDSNFVTNPNTASLYEVIAADVHVSISDADLAQGFVATATNTTTITLDGGAVATTDYYLSEMIVFTHGTGAGQAREITGYTSGRVVTMSPPLVTALSTDTVWHIQVAVSIAEIAANILTTALIETYAANGAIPTLTQAVMAIHQALMDFSISGTSITVEKLDGTTAFVNTIDDATNPTSSNRA